VDTATETATYWDDLAKPEHGIVRAEMVSVYDCPIHSPARVLINRDYLLKYADHRKQSIIALSYEWHKAENCDEAGKPYGDDDFGEFIMPGRMIVVRPDDSDDSDDSKVVGEYWGISHVYTPGETQSGN